MKRILSVAIAVHLWLIASVAGQSLGELARKEKERQKKVEGKSEVVTESGLREAEGSTVSTMGDSAKTTSSGFRKTNAQGANETAGERRSQTECGRRYVRIDPVLLKPCIRSERRSEEGRERCRDMRRPGE